MVTGMAKGKERKRGRKNCEYNNTNTSSRNMLSSEFGRRCHVRSCARRWLQLVGCATLLIDASNFGGLDGVGESRVELRRSLRQTREDLREVGC